MLIQLVNSFPPLSKWGFNHYSSFIGKSRPDVRLSAGIEKFPVIIYESQYCRVKFLLDRERYRDELWIFYGRLHAPDDERLLNWNGADHYCWHKFALALEFLDGTSPEKAAARRKESPAGVQKFLDLGLTGTIPHPEWAARMHATVWEYYGSSFFQLFDLNNPELWRRFTQCVEEYYDIVGMPPSAIPPLHQIC